MGQEAGVPHVQFPRTGGLYASPQHCRPNNDLQFASQRLRSDKAIVLLAVAQCGYAIKFASASLRSNRAVVLKALTTTALDSEARLVRGFCVSWQTASDRKS